MFKFAPIEEAPEYFGFMINNETYSINVEYVQEIIEVPPITRIPNAHGSIEGAINLRGKVLKVINLRKLLGLNRKNFDADTRVVILNIDDRSLGLIVDRVLEVFTLDLEEKKIDLPKLLQHEADINYTNYIIKHQDVVYININPRQIGAN